MTRYGRPSGWRWSCGAIVALLLLIPRVAAAAISAGPTIDLPWMQGSFSAVTAAVLADGSFAIAGAETFQRTPDEATERLEVQFFRASGAAQTPPLLIPPTQAAGGVGSLGSRYFLVWEDLKHAHAAFYSQQGTLLGQPFPWPYSDDLPIFATHYRFGNAPLWRFLPLTYVFTGFFQDSPYFRVFLRAAKPNGRLLGPPVELAPQKLVFFEDAAISGSGRFVAVADLCSQVHPRLPCVRAMQIFDDSVTPRTPLISADVPQDEGPGGVGNSAVRAAIGPQGQVLLTWFTDQQQPVSRFVARLYDQDGSPASDEVQVITPAVPDVSPNRGVKALDDGSFVLSWLVFSRVNQPAQIVVDRFDSQTKSFEGPVVLAAGPITSALLELNGAGKGVVVWQTQAFDGEGNQISNEGHLRVIQVTTR